MQVIPPPAILQRAKQSTFPPCPAAALLLCRGLSSPKSAVGHDPVTSTEGVCVEAREREGGEIILLETTRCTKTPVSWSIVHLRVNGSMTHVSYPPCPAGIGVNSCNQGTRVCHEPALSASLPTVSSRHVAQQLAFAIYGIWHIGSPHRRMLPIISLCASLSFWPSLRLPADLRSPTTSFALPK